MKSLPVVTLKKTPSGWTVTLAYQLEDRIVPEGDPYHARSLKDALDCVRDHVIMGRIVL